MSSITVGVLIAAVAAAQVTPPAPATPVPTATPRRATMQVPKGWVRVPGDTVAKVIVRSPTAPQDVRIAPMRPSTEFTGEAGLQRVRQMVARFKFAHADVSQVMVCAGTQPAILTIAKNAKGQTVMEQIVVSGETGGAVITYEIGDGRPSTEAETDLRSVCIP